MLCLFFFFFSSRRRHTRCSRDWSSDVCSSDLPGGMGEAGPADHSHGRDRGRWRDQLRLPVRGRVLRSEEHTSELQSRLHLVCRLLLEKKKSTLRPLMSGVSTGNAMQDDLLRKG